MMETIIAKVGSSDRDFEDGIIEQAAHILQQGGLVAFPTETVYGLGGNGLDAAACEKIYAAKGRPSDNPLILHISQRSELNQIVSYVPEMAEKMMKAFWPGPITLIFPKSDCVPMEVTGGLHTVAVRFPSHPVAQALIRKAGLPIAAPSANTSGKPSPTRASHVAFDLTGKIDMILDGGATEVGLESTILDVSGEEAILLRPGAITKEMIEKVIGSIRVDPAVYEKATAQIAPKAPGMKYKHYAPFASIVLVKGSRNQVISKINELVKADEEMGKKVGVLATNQTEKEYRAEHVFSLGNREHVEEIGANLFKMLRQLDFYGMDIVYSEMFDEIGEGMAIMNRLKKAAGYRVIAAEE